MQTGTGICPRSVRRRAACITLLASFALLTIPHRFDGAGGLFGGGVGFFAGACGDGAFLDVAGLQGAEVVDGFEVGGPGFVIDVKLGLLRALTPCLGGAEEEVLVAGLDIKSHGRSLGGLTVEVNLVE